MGYLGVDLFFVLSGFILAYVHLSDCSQVTLAGISQFFNLRLARIYPVHLATLIAAVVYAGALLSLGVPIFANPRYDPRLFVANLFLVQSWGWSDHPGFNVISWSISVEWLAYLVFPLLAFIVSRLPLRMALVAGPLALLAEITLLIVLGKTGMDQTATLALLRISGEFVSGMCAFVVFSRGPFPSLPMGAITDVCALSFVAFALSQASFVAVMVIPVLILGLSHGHGVAARTLSRSPFVYLGKISYSLYMVHRLIMDIVFTPLDLSRVGQSAGIAIRIPLLLLSLIIVGVAALAMHRYVEVPFRVWWRSIGRLTVFPRWLQRARMSDSD